MSVNHTVCLVHKTVLRASFVVRNMREKRKRRENGKAGVREMLRSLPMVGMTHWAGGETKEKGEKRGEVKNKSVVLSREAA